MSGNKFMGPYHHMQDEIIKKLDLIHEITVTSKGSFVTDSGLPPVIM